MSKNLELFEKVKSKIRKHHKHFDMGNFFNFKARSTQSLTACGSTGCISGWAAFICNPRVLENESWNTLVYDPIVLNHSSVDRKLKIHEIGRDLLGITEKQAQKLFYTLDWSAKFRNLYDDATSSKARAEITCDRIDYFLRTGK